jgi:precorrin-8X/cobalt-precorrin-8 methylmutase
MIDPQTRFDSHQRHYNYETVPDAIYAESFRTVRAEAHMAHLQAGEQHLAVRVMHACGMVELAANLVARDGVADAAAHALRAGAPILADCEMVRHGIITRLLPQNNDVICTLNNPETPALAQQLQTTRSAAAVQLWRPYLAGAVVAIGNAPTALFFLMEMLRNGAPAPAAIFAFPVGFVGAAESKQTLHQDAGTLLGDVPYFAVLGRKGGSAMAAAAVNAASLWAREQAA